MSQVLFYFIYLYNLSFSWWDAVLGDRSKVMLLGCRASGSPWGLLAAPPTLSPACLLFRSLYHWSISWWSQSQFLSVFRVSSGNRPWCCWFLCYFLNFHPPLFPSIYFFFLYFTVLFNISCVVISSWIFSFCQYEHLGNTFFSKHSFSTRFDISILNDSVLSSF